MEKLVLRCRISGSFVSCHLPFLIGFQWNIYLSVVFPFRFLSCKTISCQIIQTVIPFDSTDDLVMFSLSMHVILALRVTSLFILSSSWIFIFLVFYGFTLQYYASTFKYSSTNRSFLIPSTSSYPSISSCVFLPFFGFFTVWESEGKHLLTVSL